MTAAIAAGISAGAAIAGGAVVTAGAVLSIVAGTLVAVSLVMTVVGLATGDSKLMKIGGYVGLAGGVAGLAAGAAGAGASASVEGAMSAVPATSDAGTTVISQTAKDAGLQAAKANAASAVGQAATTPLATPSALPAATPIGTNLVSSGIQEAAPAATAATAPIKAGLGSDIGTNVGTNLAKTGVENQTGFFSFMDSPGFKGGLELAKLGGSVIGNMANGSMNEDFMNEKLDLQGKELGLIGERNAQTASFNNAQLAQTQQQQDYNQMVEERKYQNANTQGRGILTTRVLSAEERLAASRAKAQQAASNAQILTGAA
jgi:hypothetical protein